LKASLQCQTQPVAGCGRKSERTAIELAKLVLSLDADVVALQEFGQVLSTAELVG
jgi:dihydrodipicolinate synthase/N-acetylneuraminate lyase